MNHILAPFRIERKNMLDTSILCQMDDAKIINSSDRIEKKIKKAIEMKVNIIDLIEQKVMEFESDNEEKQVLINLKRRIYSGKELNPALEMKAAECCFDMLLEYQKIRKIRNEIVSDKEQFKKLVMSDLVQDRTIVGKTLENPFFRNTLKFINVELTHFADQYAKCDFNTFSKKNKKKELTLIKLLIKAIAKTSPFSTFTASSFQYEEAESIKEETFAYASMNITHVMKIFQFIQKKTIARKRMPYQLNPSIDKVNEYYAFSVFEDSDSNQVFHTKNKLCQLKSTNGLEAIVKLFSKNKKQNYTEINQFINLDYRIYNKLIDIGFLVPCTKIHIDRNKSIQNMLLIIKEYKLTEDIDIKDVYNIFLQISNMLETYNKESIKNYKFRDDLYEKICEKLAEAYNCFHLTFTDYRSVLYEDCVMKDVKSKKEMMNTEDFIVLSKLVILFDENIRIQNLVAELFEKKYKDEFVPTSEKEMISLMVENNNRFTFLWKDEWSTRILEDEPEISKKIVVLKKEFITLLEASLKSGIIPKKELNMILDQIPQSVLQRGNSFDFYFQKTGNELILNNIYKGFLSYFSRFIDYSDITNRSKDYKKYKDWIFDNQSKVAEIIEFQGFNANVHQVMSKYRFVTKGSYDWQHLYGADELLNFSDLFYTYSKNKKCIELIDKRGTIFRPMFLGNLVPSNLTGVFGLLNQLSSSFKMDFSIKRYCFTNKSWDKNHEILKIPELRIGDIVIQRRCFILKKENLLCLLEENHDVFTILLNIIPWFKEKELPFKFFMSGYQGGDFEYNEKNYQSKDMGDNKPIYISLTNPLIMEHFLKLLPSSEFVVIEECMPNLENESFVKEYLMELSRGESCGI